MHDGSHLSKDNLNTLKKMLQHSFFSEGDYVKMPIMFTLALLLTKGGIKEKTD